MESCANPCLAGRLPDRGSVRGARRYSGRRFGAPARRAWRRAVASGASKPGCRRCGRIHHRRRVRDNRCEDDSTPPACLRRRESRKRQRGSRFVGAGEAGRESATERTHESRNGQQPHLPARRRPHPLPRLVASAENLTEGCCRRLRMGHARRRVEQGRRRARRTRGSL